MLKKIQIPPGINKESTQYASAGSWYDANNVRFRRGKAEMVGGWSRDGTYDLQGFGRASFTSRDYSGNTYQFVGTDWKYYVIVGDLPFDITPVRDSGSTGTSPFTFVADDPNVSVGHAGHGLAVNDWVVFTSVANNVDFPDNSDASPSKITTSDLEQAHGFQVSEVTDADSYKFYFVDWTTGNPIIPATGVVGKGGATTHSYKVTSGVSTQVVGQGFGAGLWGGSGVPTSYALTTPFVTVASGSTTYILTKTGVSGSPVTLLGTDSVYITGLSGSIGLLDLTSLNDEWWDVDTVSTNSFTITGPIDPGSSASGGGSSGEFYRQNSSGVVDTLTFIL